MKFNCSLHILGKTAAKAVLSVTLQLLPAVSFSQATNADLYAQASTLLESGKRKDAYEVFKEMKKTASRTDSLYGKLIYNYVNCATELEKEARLKMDFNTSLQYGQDALQAIKENKLQFGERFATREYWMTKNVIASYFGLNNVTEANKYKEILYKAYKNHRLPEGIDKYFNYDFFRLDGKNFWGYEWYPELPADRSSGNFTKAAYYVYSTNADGTDKQQLYRYHVLMYHKVNTDLKFDYILEKQQEADSVSISGSYNQYTYNKDIDYLRLRKDVKYITTNNVQPDSRKTTKSETIGTAF